MVGGLYAILSCSAVQQDVMHCVLISLGVHRPSWHAHQDWGVCMVCACTGLCHLGQMGPSFDTAGKAVVRRNTLVRWKFSANHTVHLRMHSKNKTRGLHCSPTHVGSHAVGKTHAASAMHASSFARACIYAQTEPALLISLPGDWGSSYHVHFHVMDCSIVCEC